jgi:hypothetical protein
MLYGNCWWEGCLLDEFILYCERLLKDDFDSLVELDSFVKEFCEIGREGDSWAVVFGEDSWYEVVQV